MKPLFLLGLTVFTFSHLAVAADTAYTALRVYGKREGEQALYRVLELKGKSGEPQPSTWRLTIDEPRARGGVREIEIRGGRIVGERTPVGRNLGTPMNFTRLNLDSDGVFTVVNQEAEKRGVPFERLDYTLGSGSGGGAPLWTVELFDGRKGRVGTLRVSADTGAIVEQQFGSDRRFAEDRAYVEPERGRGPAPREREYRGEPRQYRGEEREYRGEERGPAEEVGAFINRVGRHFEKRGRQLSNFFTGRDGDR